MWKHNYKEALKRNPLRNYKRRRAVARLYTHYKMTGLYPFDTDDKIFSRANNDYSTYLMVKVIKKKPVEKTIENYLPEQKQKKKKRSLSIARKLLSYFWIKKA